MDRDHSSGQLVASKFKSIFSPSVLTVYLEKLEILVGKSNGLRYSVWEGSLVMGCDMRRCIFLLFNLEQFILIYF